MKRIYAVALAALAAILPLAAQTIKVDAPTVVGLNERFNVTFVLEDKPSSFDWTPGDNFQLVWGPQTGSSTSISIVNGKHTRSSQYTYTYVLIPRSTGNFTLPSAQAVLSGKSISSRPPKIEVVTDGASSSSSSSSAGSSAAQSRGSSSGGSPSQGSSSAASGGDDIFMRLSLSRTSVVVGEPITATLKLYTRTSVAGFEDAKFPSFNGFWSQETESPQNIEFQRESVGDKIYNSALLRRWVIIPQKTGEISIDPAELVCLVQQRISTGNSIFDGFFDDFQTIRRRVLSSAYTVKVSPLPTGAPASFTGAVGNYKISAKLSRDSLKTHDAASLSITVTGKGNVALVSAPKVSFPPDAELYDVKTSDRMDKGSGGTSGAKTFEYPFIPRSHGDFEIEPVEFSYYDVSARKYVTLSTPALPFSVAPGEASDYVSGGGIVVPSTVGKDVKNLGEDIRYISTRIPALAGEGHFFVGTPLFWIILSLIVLLCAAAYFVTVKLRATRSDVAAVRTRKASSMARKRLSLCGGYLSKGLYTAFYEELHKALLGYAADKLSISVADLSKESIASAFTAAAAPAPLVEDFVGLLDACEFARYAPDAGSDAMKAHYDKAMETISSIDANMKKKSPALKGAALCIVAALSLSGLNVQAAENYVDSLWNAGVQQYSEARYGEAAASFQAIEALSLSSPELYTNIADSYFKDRNLSQAILYYNRALRLDPSCKDARYNLQIAQSLIQDRIESVPEFFLKTWCRSLSYTLSSNAWATLFLLLFGMAAAMLLLFLLARGEGWRKTGFFSAIVCVLLAVFCISFSATQKNDYLRRDGAVVTKAVCGARSAPSKESGTDLFVLHEGTCVRILDSVGDWVNVLLSDGREGWVLSRDVTLI